MKRRRMLSLLAGAFAVVAPVLVFAEPATRPAMPPPLPAEARRAEKEAPKFLRVLEDAKAGSKLQTSSVSYVNDKGVVVRLVGVVHIGEREYYKALDKSFEDDDAVLYEMVKPKDAGVPEPGEKSDHMLAQFQRLMTDVLDLHYQLDHINYRRANFVHADIDAETFARRQKERGEDVWSLMLKQVRKAMSEDRKDEVGGEFSVKEMLKDVVALLARPDGSRQLKIRLARQFESAEKVAAGLDGPDGSVILTERNKAALAVLDAELKKPANKRLSIFYGAAHMPDLHQRLTERGFRVVATEWHTAWDLTIRADQPSILEKMLNDLIDVLD